MKKFLLFTILSAAALFSCSSDDASDSGDVNLKEEANTFEGEWSGDYTGDADNGTWEANISSEGTFSGSATSNVYNITFPMEGTVSENGEFYASYGSEQFGGAFNGMLEGNNASGTWDSTSQGVYGTWTGEKQ